MIDSHHLEDRICHILTIYPEISPSMMQIALNLAANMWKPVLEDLIVHRKVVRRHEVAPTPSGRHQTYTILSLGPNYTKVAGLELNTAEIEK